MSVVLDQGPPQSVGKVYRSAAAAIAIAWSLRLIGLVSVLVMARMLAPRDFGIVALAMSILALADIFSALGLRQALIRLPEPERAHYDTAWTIQLLLLLFLAALLTALAPLAAWFYQEPALTAVITVLAIRFVFYGLVNIGIVDFDRNLELGRDLRMRVAVRVATLLATVAAALFLRSYWALVVGAVLQSVFHAAASYLVHPYRPRFSLARRAELLGVSVWMFLASAAQTLHHEIERLVVGRLGSMHVVGLFSVSKGLSSIFTQEIATALNRVTFVTTAQTGRPLSADPGRLHSMLGAYAMIAAPLGLGLSAAVNDVVAVLLGESWAEAAPYLALIAPGAAFYAVFKLIVSSMQASGNARQAAFLSMGGAAAMALAGTGAVLVGGHALTVAWAGLGVSLMLLVAGIVALSSTARTGCLVLFLAVARPFGAALCMWLMIRSIGWSGDSPLSDLIAQVSAGSMIYAAFHLMIWLLCGRPSGAEANAMALLRSQWSRFSIRRPAEG